MTIHNEGYSTLLGAIIIGLAILIPVWLFVGATWFSFAVTGLIILCFLFLLRFFRYPLREAKQNPELIYSPADGKIIEIIEETETEYFKDKRVRISIFMSAFNVHANWLPVSGHVEYCKYHPGRNLLAAHPKSSYLNERTSVAIQIEKDREILVRQVAGIMARRVVTYPKTGQMVKQGGELGFIKFGSRLDIFIPPKARTLVKIGDKVQGSLSEIATW